MKRPSASVIALLVVFGIPLLACFLAIVARAVKKHNEAATGIREIIRSGVKKSLSDLPESQQQYLAEYDQFADWLKVNANRNQDKTEKAQAP